MRIIRALSFTLFVFGLLGWLYIVLNAAVHMETLHLPLTHFLPWPREDTFGAGCFAVSLVSLFVYRFVTDRIGK